jgi:hypothetical protein
MNGATRQPASQHIPTPHIPTQRSESPTAGQPWDSGRRTAPASAPLKKVRRWPWAIGGLVLGLVIGASAARGGSTPAPAALTAPAAPTITVAAAAPVAPAPVATVEAPAPVVPAPVATEAAAPAVPAATTGQRNALGKATSYLSYSAFSKAGLAKQLKFEGFSDADAAYAVEHVGANWTEQADKKAAAYMSYSSFSKSGLIKQLRFEGFSADEAAHGAASVGL